MAQDAEGVRFPGDGLEEAEEVARGGGVGEDLEGFSCDPGRGGEAGMVEGVFGRELRSGEKGGEGVGLTKVGKGTKRMLVVDGKGVPLAVFVASAGVAEVRLAREVLERVGVPRGSPGIGRGRWWRTRPTTVMGSGFGCGERGSSPVFHPAGAGNPGGRPGKRNTGKGGWWNVPSPGSTTSVAWWYVGKGSRSCTRHS